MTRRGKGVRQAAARVEAEAAVAPLRSGGHGRASQRALYEEGAVLHALRSQLAAGASSEHVAAES